ncbi:hypothetical protein MTO96_037309, partial [Rhipicephalus appendiculatus]
IAKSEEYIFKQRHRQEVSIRAAAKERAEMKADDDEEERQAMTTDERLADVETALVTKRSTANSSTPRGVKRSIDSDSSEDEDSPEDEVRLWEDGWKDRYYVAKFDASPENTAFRQNVAREYIRGLCWVLRYYVQGCASWTWFFPHLYAPFASDFDNIGDVTIDFDPGTEPVKPMEQLMSVLPASSNRFLPEALADLMDDPLISSCCTTLPFRGPPIADFYPLGFKIDLNGHKHDWQGVALLPFIEQARLLNAIRTVYPLLDNKQVNRNSEGDDILYAREGHPAYDAFATIYEASDDYDEEFDLDTDCFMGIGGKFLLSRKAIPHGRIAQFCASATGPANEASRIRRQNTQRARRNGHSEDLLADKIHHRPYGCHKNASATRSLSA